MKRSSNNNVKIKQLVKDTRKLFSRCMGVLFVYTTLFAIFRDFIFLPVSRKLWSLSLFTVKEGYISDHNISSLLTHPLVLMAGVVAVTGYCIISLWEVSGITMILEYSYREQPVRLFSIFPESFKQIKHCLQPRNWAIFVYLLVIQPWIDSDFSGQMMSEITIPEYIGDYIFARTLLTVLIVVFTIVVFVFFVRYLFLPVIMILEKKNFKEAAEKSVTLLKGRFLSTYIKIVIASLIGSIILRIVPYLISYGLEFGLSLGFSGYEFSRDIGRFVFSYIVNDSIDSLMTIFIKLFVSAMVLSVFHFYEKQREIEIEIDIPNECIKTSAKVYTFKGFIYGIYSFMFAVAIFVFIALVLESETNPLNVAEIINTTQVAAHKGYSSKAPENTLPAFELATNCDVVDYIELDVRETKDGIPVVIHDASIKAATGENILIYDLTFEELKEHEALYGFSSDEFANNRIPSLDEVLSKYAGKKNFIIEIKASDKTPKLPEKIVELMEKYNITETSMIHSGSYESLKAVKEINPDIKCGFIIAVSAGGYEDLPYADFFSVEHSYLSSNIISNVHKRGKEVFVWTVNESKSFEHVRDMGADVLITDYPEDAYEGMHRYDSDMMDRLFNEYDVSSLDELIDIGSETINYNGSGD